MNPGGRLDLDALLARWPAPARDDDAWDARAEAVLGAALAADGPVDEAIFAPPPLVAADGEPDVGLGSSSGSGEVKMSQESDQVSTGEGAAPKGSDGAPTSDATKASGAADAAVEPAPSVAPRSADEPRAKKPSLREIAARASQSGARASIPGTATPLPGSVRPGPRSQSSPGLATSTPIPSRPAPKPEIADEDSGIVNLKAVTEAAEAKEKEKAEAAAAAAAAAAAPPASSKGAASEKPAAAASEPAASKVAAAQAAPVAMPRKGGGGAMTGVVIAVLGLAAAFFIVQRGKQAPPVVPPHGEGIETAPVVAIAPAKPAGTAQAAATAVAAGTAAPGDTAAPDTSAAAGGDAPKALGGPMPNGAALAGKGGPAPSGTPSAAPGAGAPAAVAAAPQAAGKPGDLAGAMAQAVGGGQGAKPNAAETPEPAAGVKSQNIPEQPSQGKVQAAIGSVMGGAKSCVAGASDVSRAQITFSSSGAVSNVSVTGWAASNGQSGCIKSALKGASVGPFAKSTFTVGVTIRP
jgi:hypothetical protein